jgi:ADP-heptose:LPS heptosyltransferase
MIILKKKNKEQISLKDHYSRRNKVLIKRRTGGFGDILMQRMLYEDFKIEFPELEFNFTCPNPYINFAKDHPFAETIDINRIDETKFGIIYDISTTCRVHEIKTGSTNNVHRSDIWASYCGTNLKNHNIHLEPKKDAVDFCIQYLKTINPENKPVVIITSNSVDDEFGSKKSIKDSVLEQFVLYLKNKNYFICGVHQDEHPLLKNLGIHQITNLKYDHWIALVSTSDYVVSVDTATLHLAGGLKTPLLGVFNFTKGKVYTKYYPNVEIVQGFCPYKTDGCFNYYSCPESQDLPCQNNITSNQLIKSFENLVKRFPYKSKCKLEIKCETSIS